MHRFAFIHKETEIAFRLGQGQGALKARQRQGQVPLRLVDQRLRHQDLKDAANPALRFSCFQQALQQTNCLQEEGLTWRP